MTHEASQPTLAHSLESPSAPRARALTLLELIAALALRRATREAAPLSPSDALTAELVSKLSGCGLIRTADASQPLPYHPVERALYDPIVFVWNEDMSAGGNAEETMLCRIREHLQLPSAVDEVVAIWHVLAEAELEGYLQYLLRKHGLPTYWSISARLLAKSWLPQISLARLRYVAWASIRAAASTYLCTNGNLDETRRHFENSLRQRPIWLAADLSAGATFAPAASQKAPLVVSVYRNDVSRLGMAYWAVPPSVEALARYCNSPAQPS